MSWLKIDDQIGTHHKTVKAGPAASWLWICCIAYAQNHLTDGFISDAVVGHLGVPKHSAEALLKRLLQHGLLERTSGGFQVHDYLKHNTSAAQRKRDIRDKVRAGRIGGQSMQAKRRAGLKGQANSQQPAAARRRSVLQPTPIHSDPLRTKGRPPTADVRKDGGTNTAGGGADQRRRATPDGGPSAPASVPVDPPLDDDDTDPRVREILADGEAVSAVRRRKL